MQQVQEQQKQKLQQQQQQQQKQQQQQQLRVFIVNARLKPNELRFVQTFNGLGHFALLYLFFESILCNFFCNAPPEQSVNFVFTNCSCWYRVSMILV